MQLESRLSGNLVQQQTAPATTAGRRNPKLERSAHEFEAGLMSELIKPLQQSDGLTGEESEDVAGSGGALASFASESLARAISERGGFGIADRILHQLESPKSGGTKGLGHSGLKFSASAPI